MQDAWDWDGMLRAGLAPQQKLEHSAWLLEVHIELLPTLIVRGFEAESAAFV
jgi:hypothetical protein